MDKIDRDICNIIQKDGRVSSAEIAKTVGVSTSTANDRVRRLASNNVIKGWHGRLDPEKVGAGLCAFILIDMAYEGEAEACQLIAGRSEVLELHHISGGHSYLVKIRVENTGALQQFLATVLKPVKAIQNTETIISLEAKKETNAVLVAGLD